jgi:SET domain-containing protein
MSHQRRSPALDAPPALVTFGPSTLHGRGVFACRDIAAGETVERCAVLTMPACEYELVSSLHGYVWCADDDTVVLALGCGSLYNHTDDPSCTAELDLDDATLWIVARRDIAAGEELTVSYGEEYWHGEHQPV